MVTKASTIASTLWRNSIPDKYAYRISIFSFFPTAARLGYIWKPVAVRSRQESTQMGKPAQIDIVRRAYELWQQAGEPQGRDQEFYHQAEKELQEALDKSTPKTQG